MFNYKKSIEYQKLLIISLCSIGIVCLITLAIYSKVDDQTPGVSNVTVTPSTTSTEASSRFNLNTTMTPTMLNSTTAMPIEVPTSLHSVSTEKEATSYSTTTMSKEKEARPNSSTTMSTITKTETTPNATKTMSTEKETTPDSATTMSKEKETLPDSITTMSTEKETTADSATTMSKEKETLPDSATAMLTKVQTLNQIATKEETELSSTRTKLPTDNKSQLLKAIQHTQSIIQNCSKNADCQTNQICSHTLNQCFCDFGYAFDSKGQCLENNECDCLEGSYSDNSSCSKEQTLDFLLVVKDIVVKRVEPSEDNEHPQTYIAVENDCVNKTAYYVRKSSTSYGESEMLKISYNGDKIVSFIQERGFIEGISIDWTLKNIYLIKSNKIKVGNLQRDELTTLIEENIINPRDIVVHPGKGKIFWSNWYPENNTTQLMWANINGSDISVFYEGDKVQYPNALAINWVKNQLCWSDKITKEINCVGIDNTTNLQTIATGVFEPYDLEITADNYYWTNLEKKEIWEFDGNDKKQQVIMSIPDDADSILYGLVGVTSTCPELQ